MCVCVCVCVCVCMLVCDIAVFDFDKSSNRTERKESVIYHRHIPRTKTNQQQTLTGVDIFIIHWLKCYFDITIAETGGFVIDFVTPLTLEGP